MKEDLKKEFNKLIERVELAGVDLDLITFHILSDFKLKSLAQAKQFDRAARKDSKNIRNFVKNKILPFWITYVESCCEEARDLRVILPKDDFLNYLSGIYILIHSKKINNLDFMLKYTLAEMFQKVAIVLNERGLIDKEVSING